MNRTISRLPCVYLAAFAMLALPAFVSCCFAAPPASEVMRPDAAQRAAIVEAVVAGSPSFEVTLPDAWRTGGAEAAESAAPTADGGGGESLAKAAQNPVANMISVPFQNNFNLGVGPGDKYQNLLNIQPVIPIKLSESWNLITRTIVPVVYQQEGVVPGLDSQFGLGDTTLTAFLSPAKPGKVIWGVGPAFLLPTATDDVLGTGKWGVGPSVVVLTMPGHWVLGGLLNNIWSVAGADDRADVNAFTFQPFVNYNFEKGWYASFSPVITANWEAPSDQRWTVPLGLGVGRVFKLGCQPVNISLAYYYNVEHPDLAAEQQIRFQFVLLFPTGKK